MRKSNILKQLNLNVTNSEKLKTVKSSEYTKIEKLEVSTRWLDRFYSYSEDNSNFAKKSFHRTRNLSSNIQIRLKIKLNANFHYRRFLTKSVYIGRFCMTKHTWK